MQDQHGAASVAVQTESCVARSTVLALPLACTLALAAMALLPAVQNKPRLLAAFLGPAVLLMVWNALLFVQQRGSRARLLAVQVALRPQHYLQACAQGSVLLYWGWFWPQVYATLYLLLAQLVFAYAFDMLLSWSRRDTYSLGFAPFPVVFSINLFLWFREEWFWWQFLMIAVGLAAKELIRWEKEGRWVHIFNPSSFPLALLSLVLILTGQTDKTWGPEIASTLNNPPYIYLLIFLIGLPGQYFFGVTTMTMSAVTTMYAFGLVYFALTGTYYFVDAYIPIAVFLGMHLLFTDPSTAPRSELGRVMFGITYALSVVALYYVLGYFGVPTFYDKLLAVPLMNVAIKAIERMARSHALRAFDPSSLASGLIGRKRNLAYIAVWAAVFLGMNSTQAVGDTHRGRWVPFQQEACDQGRPNGCRNLGVMLSRYCASGSGWACNEYGILLQPARRPELAADAFTQACDLGFSAGCQNLTSNTAHEPIKAPPAMSDYRIVLRLKGDTKGLADRDLYRQACTQGFADGCHRACESGDHDACGSAVSRR